MPILVLTLAVCLIFCLPVRHAPKYRAPACEKIVLAYASKSGSRDDFVKSFPVEKQRKVLKCIGD